MELRTHLRSKRFRGSSSLQLSRLETFPRQANLEIPVNSQHKPHVLFIYFILFLFYARSFSNKLPDY